MVYRLLILALGLLTSHAAHAQLTTERQALAPAGGQLTAANLQLSFTTGEPVVGYLPASASTLAVNLGFQQGNLMISDLDEWVDRGFPRVWPNPFHHDLHVAAPRQEGGRLGLVDHLGRLVFTQELQPGDALRSFWLADLPAGPYTLLWQTRQRETTFSLSLIKS